MVGRKIAVISGGTKGIGNALAKLLIQEHFEVYTSARNPMVEPVEHLHVYQADLSIKEEVLGFAHWVREQVDAIDLLANNVGSYIPGKISSEEDGVFEAMINLNLASTYHLSRALIPLLIGRTGAYIFNICSTASKVAYVNGGSYCISKFGQLGLTKVLREEMKEHNIRVSAVLPGATLTDSWSGTTLPEDRFLQPSSVAQLIWSAYQLPASVVVEEILVRPMDGDIS